MLKLRTALATAATVLACSIPAWAQPVTWTGAGDGTSWNQPGNWSPVGLPGPANDVTIPAGASTINVNTAATVRTITTDRPITASGCSLLTITNGLTFTSAAGSLSTSTSFCDSVRLLGTQSVSGPGQLIIRSGTLRIAGAGNTVTVAADATVQQSGSGDISLDANTSLVNNGRFRANASTQSMNITGAATASFVNGAGGFVEASSSGTVVISALPWTNSGTFLINAGTLNLSGVYSSLGTVSRTGGTLTITGNFSGPTLTANATTGTIAFASGLNLAAVTLNAADGQGFAVSGGVAFNNVTLNSPLTLTGCNVLTVSNGLTFGGSGSITTASAFCQTLVFSGTQTISGTGTINLGNGSMGVTGAGTVLTIAPGIIIQAAGSNGSVNVPTGCSIQNQGTFRANAASRVLEVIGQGSFTNAAAATVEASAGGTINMTLSSWTNGGTYLINAGTLNLGGTYASLGTISRTGGTLSITGVYAGPTLTANAATGSIVLASGLNLTNVALNVADGQGFSQSGSIAFNSVTLNAPLPLSGCSVLTVSNGLTFGGSGSITTASAFCQTLVFSGTQTISGTGTINLGNGSMGVTGAGTVLTIAPGIIIQAAGSNGSVNVPTGCSIQNQGTFRANAASRVLEVVGQGSFTNAAAATVEASAGGTMNMMLSSWTNSGTFLINAGTLNLGGTYSSLGTVSRTGGTLSITGTFTGSTLTANAATGPIVLTSSINLTNVTLNVADGQSFSQGGGITFNNVTLNAPLTLSGCSVLTVTNGLTFGGSGSITTANSFCQTLSFSGTQTISGTGTINLGNGSMGVTGAGTVLTLGPGIIIQAANANASVAIPAGGSVLNQGTIRANAASRALTIDGAGTFTNASGSNLEASNTGTINVNNGSSTLAWSNAGTLTLNNATMNLGGTLAGLGTISRTGGTLTFSGIYTGPSLTLSNVTGPITFASGAAFNGTSLSAIDGQSYALSGGASFNNVTLNAPINLNGCSVLTVTGGLAFGPGGSVSTGAAFCQTLNFSGTQAVTGTGTITLNAGSMGVVGTSATLTLGPSITIVPGGSNGNLSVNAGNALINQGAIRASGASRSMTLTGNGVLTNAPGATLEASSGGTLAISSLTWVNNGTLVVNNGTANLGGTCAGLGVISRSGGTINLTANYTGPVLTISNATGPINFAGGIVFSGTTLNALDGQVYGLSGGATFNAVTLNAPIALSGCSVLTVSGGLTLGATGSITTGVAFCQTLTFTGTQTLSGSGSITLNNGSMGVSGTGAVLTVASGVTIQAGNANATIQIADGASMVNQGRLLASGVNKSLQLSMANTGTFTNDTAGVVEANTSGTVVLNITATNTGTLRAGTNGTITVSSNRTLTNSAGGTIEIEGTGPNATNDFGHIRVAGTLAAGGTLAVTYPNGLVQGCLIGVTILNTQPGGTITGTFANRVGPAKPAPFASLIAVSGSSYFFTSTNQADVGSAGGVAQPDGILDNNDFIVYIDLFFATSPLADRGSTGGVPGADGVFDNNDFIVYIDQFFAGCS